MNLDQIQYEFDSASWSVIASYRGVRIGYLWSNVSQDARIKIADLRVENDRPVPFRFANNIWVNIGFRLHRRSFRRMGIGTELVNILLNNAEKAGFKEVWGEVTKSDIKEFPAILNWYRHFGFESKAPDNECEHDSAAKIFKYLPNKPVERYASPQRVCAPHR